MKIEKQAIPIFFNERNQPIAALLFVNKQRVIYNLTAASEEDIVNLYEKKDDPIKEAINQEKTCGNVQNVEKA